MKQNDVNWFRPLWRRVLVTAVVVVWCVWEWVWNQDQFWGVLTAALLAYAVYSFFISFPKDDGDTGR